MRLRIGHPSGSSNNNTSTQHQEEQQQRRLVRRRRGTRSVEFKIIFTICLVSLSLLTLVPLDRNSVQNINSEIDLPLPLPQLPLKFRNITATIPQHLQFQQSNFGCGADYFRSNLEWEQKTQQQTICSPTLEVFSWLMDQVNSRNLTMMIGYGELIHLLREKALIHSDGTYYDDDFDTWVTPSSFETILKLEPYLWNNFGWSIRVFFRCSEGTKDKQERHKTNIAIFAQILPVCGHQYKAVMEKAVAKYPAIEMYVLQSIGHEQEGILHENWQGELFPEGWLLPAKPFPFDMPGFNKTLNLQIPAQSEKLLDCMYGNWHVYSTEHHDKGENCTSSIAKS